MKKTLLVLLILASTTLATTNRFGDVPDEDIATAVKLIRAWGYRCDTVTEMGFLVWATGYRVICNGWDGYEYHIKDKGGRVVVELK
jgi:hypothetical protein